jgi:hypothetical protein
MSRGIRMSRGLRMSRGIRMSRGLRMSSTSPLMQALAVHIPGARTLVGLWQALEVRQGVQVIHLNSPGHKEVKAPAVSHPATQEMATSRRVTLVAESRNLQA